MNYNHYISQTSNYERDYEFFFVDTYLQYGNIKKYIQLGTNFATQFSHAGACCEAITRPLKECSRVFFSSETR